MLVLTLFFINLALKSSVHAFIQINTYPTTSTSTTTSTITSILTHIYNPHNPYKQIQTLYAKKKSKSNNKNQTSRATRNKIGKRTSSTSGFGGAAIEPCPCGSQLGYMKCCGLIHTNADAFANATPEQVVRARYSAYAKRNVDFIIGSTHPLNERNFMTDIDHWRETIKYV